MSYNWQPPEGVSQDRNSITLKKQSKKILFIDLDKSPTKQYYLSEIDCGHCQEHHTKTKRAKYVFLNTEANRGNTVSYAMMNARSSYTYSSCILELPPLKSLLEKMVDSKISKFCYTSSDVWKMDWFKCVIKPQIELGDPDFAVVCPTSIVSTCHRTLLPL
ncbi:hypothetical protein KIN20_023880 [Parelaphostrongylus tenuis]|uniref:Uncharacterized protein n=1 Tax=Parelaphostrongylus tenuis TaxID=148309 RepID=A0AAD5N9I6_PARTN|nr:hypothetical protein KIN20_023880 [Parelaphostrongylus tenuis]